MKKPFYNPQLTDLGLPQEAWASSPLNWKKDPTIQVTTSPQNKIIKIDCIFLFDNHLKFTV